jgi:hypothetical protein
VLAAAHADVGEFDKAVEYQKKAMENPGYASQSGKAAQERLSLYQDREPYRE